MFLQVSGAIALLLSRGFFKGETWRYWMQWRIGPLTIVRGSACGELPGGGGFRQEKMKFQVRPHFTPTRDRNTLKQPVVNAPKASSQAPRRPMRGGGQKAICRRADHSDRSPFRFKNPCPA